MRLDDLEHEQAVPPDQARIREPALEVGVAFGDERRADLLGGDRGEPELGELVGVGAGAVPDADDLPREFDGRDVDHALLATPDQPEAMVLIPYVTADQGWRKSHTMCQPSVMMFFSRSEAELTRTTGPGSMNRRTCETGKSLFL